MTSTLLSSIILSSVIGITGTLIIAKLNGLSDAVDKIFDIIRENEKMLKEDLKEYRTAQSCNDFRSQHEKEHIAMREDINNIANMVRSKS